MTGMTALNGATKGGHVDNNGHIFKGQKGTTTLVISSVVSMVPIAFHILCDDTIKAWYVQYSICSTLWWTNIAMENHHS